MAGVEVVGTVLAVLPLIVTAIEHYEKIGDLILTYRRYSKEVRKFNTELAVQRVIFQNECVLLLSEVVDDERALRDMFKEPTHGLRKCLRDDDNLDRKLGQRVNERVHDSYKQIAALLELTQQSLEQIYEETKNYEGELNHDASKPDVNDISLSTCVSRTLTSIRETRSTSKTGHITFAGRFDLPSGSRPLESKSTAYAAATRAFELFPTKFATLKVSGSFLDSRSRTNWSKKIWRKSTRLG